jgi:hypothetical protein
MEPGRAFAARLVLIPVLSADNDPRTSSLLILNCFNDGVVFCMLRTVRELSCPTQQ